MDLPLPSAEDHCRIQILIKPLGQLHTPFFNRILQRLSRAETIEISENPKRVIFSKFITGINSEHVKFSEFQSFRKIFGLIGIGQSSSTNLNQFPYSKNEAFNNNEESSSSQADAFENLNNTLLEVKECYNKTKQQLNGMLVDSRCILFGFTNANKYFDPSDLLEFPILDDSNELEIGVRELIRSIYFVLESRRLDLAFEKMEAPICPILPEEEKYRMGLDINKSKIRKKCIGRLRKQVADNALLTGLPTLAMNSYESAIDYLIKSEDFLWLGAALEGWCCAAMLVKYKSKFEKKHRNSRLSATGSELGQKDFQRHLNLKGHQRYRSDGHFLDSQSLCYEYKKENDSMNNDSEKNSTIESTNTFLKVPLAGKTLSKENRIGSSSKIISAISSTITNGVTDLRKVSASLPSYTEILERFRAALENYGRFSFAANVEYECAMRAVAIFVFHRLYIETEAFLRDRMGKFLDDKFYLFDNAMKAQICLACASVYNSIGFRRKNAFFLRLSVLFRLDVANEENPTTAKDYEVVYPILYTSLRGYGIGWGMEPHGFVGFGSDCEQNPTSSRTKNLRKNSTVNTPLAIQIKAVYEVFMSAYKAQFYDAAIRHLCFILQNYYDDLDKGMALTMIEELNKMVALKKEIHSLSQPISLDFCGIVLPPIQFSRFPILSYKVIELPPQLAPNVIDPGDLASKIFIYSPFQRDKAKGLYWVVGCACEVSVSVRNPLPIELLVKNLALLTEGCEFESFPVRLNLPSCFGSIFDPSSSTIKLVGVPRSPGHLKLTGYTCEVLGVRSVCALRENSTNSKNPKNAKNSTSQNDFTVEVLQALPLLQLETSLKRAPTVDDTIEAIAEATVFSGQTFEHSIYLFNSSKEIAIKKVVIKINQPKVCGGPKLIQLMDFSDSSELLSESARRNFQPEIHDLGPLERREIRIRIFGIDPSATTAAFGTQNPQNVRNRGPLGHLTSSKTSAGQTGTLKDKNSQTTTELGSLGEEHRVYVKRHTSLSLNSPSGDLPDTKISSLKSLGSLQNDENPLKSPKYTSSRSNSEMFANENMSLLGANSNEDFEPTVVGRTKKGSIDTQNLLGHDLIPYTGRLLSADFEFTYTADVEGPNSEKYERIAKLPLAIAIVPAVNVSDWHILSGDSPLTRYVVVDVANRTDMDAELTYSNGRMLWVQPKEVCRVPLLCPCCADIQSSEFAAAAQQASHMMQMREIERLRRSLEKHVSKHLDIRWSIPALKLDGFVPVGSLLSSVSFLKQLVIPAISVSIHVNNAPYVSEDDVSVGIGELINIGVSLLISLKCKNPINGEIALRCYQDLQNGQPSVDRSENVVLCGPCRVPFSIKSTSTDKSKDSEISFKKSIQEKSSMKTTLSVQSVESIQNNAEMGRFETSFSLLFRYEGIHKIRPEILNLEPLIGEPKLSEDDIFLPTVSFNVVTKLL